MAERVSSPPKKPATPAASSLKEELLSGTCICVFNKQLCSKFQSGKTVEVVPELSSLALSFLVLLVYFVRALG
jgi:hypothetical protein